MKTAAALAYFRGQAGNDRGVSATARAAGLRRGAVQQWGEVVPCEAAYRLWRASGGGLALGESDYSWDCQRLLALMKTEEKG